MALENGYARRGLALAFALVPLLAGACTINPESGKREVILMSEETEREIDEEVARQVEQEIGLVQDEELTAYVRELGEELASHALRRNVDYVFNIVEMEEPNAFALPGGHIYLSRGLMVLANSEAEIANVLGHEIGHVTSRHAAQRDARQKMITFAALLASVAAAAAGEPEAAAAGGQFLAMGGVQQAVAAYSRSQESEADRIGQDLAAESGFDPKGMADFLNQLDDYTRLRMGASRVQGWFDSHPATPERVADTVTRAQVLRWTPDLTIEPAPLTYLERIDGMAVDKPASEGVLRAGRFLHADLGFALRFPSGWQVINSRARVLAVTPGRDGLVMLELQGPGDDPRAAAAADAQSLGLGFDKPSPVRVGDLPAFRARTSMDTPFGRSAAEVTWIAFGGNIYRLTGTAPNSRFGRYEGTFRSFSRSFRPMRPEEYDLVDELRVRIAVARHGETLEELGRRTGNEWDVTTTAVVNALRISTPLAGGQRIKIAKREPYRPKPRAAVD